ncbi:MAG: hypothetical protein IKT63_06615 [Oscillospiraceae bacterium]|nr:hypothetical protein [Oscillospiraceae bacterium]
MDNRLDKNMRVQLSMCDNTSKMGILGLFYLVMDLATEHGDDINLGAKVLSPKGLFWVASKTKLKIHRMPEILENITASTWPEAPGRIRCNRFYSVKCGEEMLAEGKTEWAIVEKDTGKPHRLADVYPEGMTYCDEIVCDEPFAKPGIDFADCEKIGEYTVKSTDIDVSQHMNNVAYIRAAFSAFTVKEIEEMNISEVEAVYRVQCFEGEKLSLCIRKEENAFDIGVIKEDEKTAAVVRFICG